MTQTEFTALPKVGPICYAAAQDVLLYKESPAVGRHIPGVFDVALWSTDQMRAYVTAAGLAERAQRVPLTADAALELATKEFPYWREDIQTAFVLQLIRAVERAHGIGDE